jgi:hypothetical protein
MAVPSAYALIQLIDQYIKFQLAANRASDRMTAWKEKRYQHDDEKDLALYALNLWQSWDFDAAQLVGTKGWPPHVGVIIRGAMRFVHELVIDGWQWDLVTLDYPTVERAAETREVELKEANARCNTTYEIRREFLEGAQRAFIEGGGKTGDPDADTEAFHRFIAEEYAPFHAAVEEANAEQMRLWRAPLVSSVPAEVSPGDLATLREWTVKLHALGHGEIGAEHANEAAAEYAALHAAMPAHVPVYQDGKRTIDPLTEAMLRKQSEELNASIVRLKRQILDERNINNRRSLQEQVDAHRNQIVSNNRQLKDAGLEPSPLGWIIPPEAITGAAAPGGGTPSPKPTFEPGIPIILGPTHETLAIVRTAEGNAVRVKLSKARHRVLSALVEARRQGRTLTLAALKSASSDGAQGVYEGLLTHKDLGILLMPKQGKGYKEGAYGFRDPY